MGAWLQTMRGRAFELRNPVVEREHLFIEIAPALAKLARFAGHTELPYSVAQHSVLGAEAVLDTDGDRELAAFALLHDAHEAYLGDKISPVKEAEFEEIVASAIDARVSEVQAQSIANRIVVARRALERRIDRAILAAAGLSFERYATRKAEVHRLDLQLLATERRDLLLPHPRLWFIDKVPDAPKPLRLREGSIRAWPWDKAERRFRAAVEQLCPAV